MQKLLITYKSAYMFWINGIKRPHPDNSRCTISETDCFVAKARLINEAKNYLIAANACNHQRRSGGTLDSEHHLSDIVRDSSIDAPLDVCVFDRVMRRNLLGTKCHLWSGNDKRNSICRLTPNIMIASPEMTFLSLASRATIQDLIAYGNSLCSTFPVLQIDNPYVDERMPLTSVKRLNDYLNNSAKSKGRNKAKRALTWVCEGAASQREVTLATILFTPRIYGGIGLPKAQLNYRIMLNPAARSIASKDFLVADIVWPDKKIAVEYDSYSHHSSREKLEADSRRRNALISMGYNVVTITNEMLKTERGRFDIENTLSSMIYPYGRKEYCINKNDRRQVVSAAFRAPSGKI